MLLFPYFLLFTTGEAETCTGETEMCSLKFVTNTFSPSLQSEGSGATVRRVIGSSILQSFSPFLKVFRRILKKPSIFFWKS